jgi:hypothetical protein
MEIVFIGAFLSLVFGPFSRIMGVEPRSRSMVFFALKGLSELYQHFFKAPIDGVFSRKTPLQLPPPPPFYQ